MSELTDPAQRAGSTVIEHIKTVIEAAEHQADELRRGAERDSEATRRQALESARRVFEHIHALERPLTELVQSLLLETERVERELAGDVDAQATAIASEPESTRAAIPEAPAEGPAANPGSPAAETESAGRKEPQLPRVSPTSQPGPTSRASRFLARFREDDAGENSLATNKLLARFRENSASDAFITTEGHCAVCQKAFVAGSEEELKASDWKANGDVGLCPECQSNGWQLPAGAKLPFRRGGRGR